LERKTVLVCTGTRPEVIKLAPVHHALAACGIDAQLLHTGQHGPVVNPLFHFFRISPHWKFRLAHDELDPGWLDNEFDGKPTHDFRHASVSSLSRLAAHILQRVDAVIQGMRPDAVLVQGDTISALMCALAAFYARVPVGHVEAGLRTGRTDPFPEEMNRRLIAGVARWHFTPTPQASRNLLREGVRSGVHLVGNTVVDAVHQNLHALDALSRRSALLPRDLSQFLDQQGGRRLLVVTAHRRENWGDPIRNIAGAILDIATAVPDCAVVWPLHPNPKIRDMVLAVLDGASNGVRERIHAHDPLEYAPMLWVLRQSAMVLTDSGGIQEEAATLGRPVIVLRESTERPELIRAKGGVLAGASRKRIGKMARDILASPERYMDMCLRRNPFGDGRASERIAHIMARDLSMGSVAAERSAKRRGVSRPARAPRDDESGRTLRAEHPGAILAAPGDPNFESP
jgi:UDP-N-acetylglucosamine 2-epimerase (non-hydrolysing)